MACRCRFNKKMADLNHVRLLAKMCAEMDKVDQIIYKVYGYGIWYFNFSSTWKGKAVEIVRYIREDTNKVIDADNKIAKSAIADQEKPKKAKPKRRTVKKDLGTDN